MKNGKSRIQKIENWTNRSSGRIDERQFGKNGNSRNYEWVNGISVNANSGKYEFWKIRIQVNKITFSSYIVDFLLYYQCQNSKDDVLRIN